MAEQTLEDIAKLAGVSRSTVSRVINNQPYVSEPVRQHVKEVIKLAGYHPNAAARTLASQRSWMIGLVLPRNVSSFFSDPYFPRLTQGIAQACNQHNYTLALFLVSTKDDEEKIFPRLSRKGSLDGVLLQSGQIGDQLMERLVNSQIPLVICGRPLQTEQVSYIDVDNFNAAYNAVSHLIRLGYQRIAHISGMAGSAVTIDRLAGYRKALVDRDCPLDETLIAEGDFSAAGGYYAMRKLLSARPEAVFVASDLMAVGAMRAVREAGLSIPQDIAFVGFDDLPIATQVEPQLSTICQPILEFGSRAVDILIDLIENGIKPDRHIILDTKLILRESCGAYRSRQGPCTGA